MGTRLLASAAMTSLLLAAIAAPTPAAAQTAAQHTALASDSNFIQTAMSLGLLQVKLAEQAQAEGTSEVVRDFGKRMLIDYTTLNARLQAGAKQAAYPHPVVLRPHQKVLDRFNYMGRSHFDKEYMTVAVTQHDELVRLVQQEAKDGRVALLKQLAASLLPDLQQDQARAHQAAVSVGAEFTASATR